MARLSQAAAAGTVAVFKCFAAQAHATLVGLMHIRSPLPPPAPPPPSTPPAFRRLSPPQQDATSNRCSGITHVPTMRITT